MRKDADGDVKRNRLDYRRGARRASNHEWTPIAVPSRKVNPGLRIETGGTQGFVVPDRGRQENSKAYLAPGDLGAGAGADGMAAGCGGGAGTPDLRL